MTFKIILPTIFIMMRMKTAIINREIAFQDQSFQGKPFIVNSGDTHMEGLSINELKVTFILELKKFFLID
jgi:hypothetical protein